ncbi:MAG: 23S rRNA (uracil(1939)-C(5))-methyltransferase RlmD [Clostridia bacterium]|nr:23S rRNA (uracil(1939)-C(5))-methyltransferase RlmD [Clostridia bacterium]
MANFIKKSNDGQEESKATPLTLTVTRFDDAFCGIGYIGSRRYVVPGALPKELLEIKPQKVFNNINYASIVKVLEPSLERVAPVCKYYKACGSCNMMHINYDASVKAKTGHLKKKLAALNAEISPCVSLEEFGNRNKVHIVFSRNGRWVDIGFFNEETHKVVDVPVCMMHGKWYSDLVQILRKWIVKKDIPIYNPITGEGTLRFAVARRLSNTLQLTFVVTSPKLDGLEGLLGELQNTFGEISLWLNHNNERSNEVFAGKFIHLMGDAKIYSEMLGIKFDLSPNSFFQVNNEIATKIYQKVIDTVKESGAEYVIDAFSGIGIVSALLAKEGLQVAAIEIVKEAVADARAIAKVNGVDKSIKVICGDIKDVLPTLKLPRNTALFVDPPRKGLGEEVVASILRLAPPTVIYLSCNPDTLAADLALLAKDSYNITYVQPYDMFPHTKHIETLVCMTRK